MCQHLASPLSLTIEQLHFAELRQPSDLPHGSILCVDLKLLFIATSPPFGPTPPHVICPLSCMI